MKYDIIIIGSGPGGYVAAIRAAQLGRRVALVERAEAGGVCLNWGCIPTKALLRSAQVYETCRAAAQYGVEIAGDVRPDLEKIVARSRSVAETMSKGVQFLLRKNNIDLIHGFGRLKGPGRVEVDGAEYEADHIILATGARPRARGQNDVVGLVLRSVDLYAPRALEAAEAVDEVDIVLPEQELHPFGHGLGHAARAGHDLLQIGAHVARDLHAVLCRRAAGFVDLGAAQQRLGGDAAPVEAHAARLGALDERHPAAQLCCADRRHVAAGARSDDDDVVFHRAPTSLL